MYNEYWRLNEKPFEPSADGSFYFPCESHQGAILKLRYAVENRRGAAVITGPAGSGKTVLIRRMYRQLVESFKPRVHLVYPQMSGPELLLYVADALASESAQIDRPPLRASVEASVLRIEQALAANVAAGRHAVVVIDEAHLLAEAGNLETMRLLLNFEVDGQPAMTLVLVGQNALLPALARMPSLDQRLSIKTMLRPLTVEETVSYVHHRMAAAGGAERVFGSAALDALFEHSQGVPRQINRLCDLSLLVGFAEQQETITADHIHSVSDELVAVSPE
jgi:general secretion pathway protein A